MFALIRLLCASEPRWARSNLGPFHHSHLLGVCKQAGLRINSSTGWLAGWIFLVGDLIELANEVAHKEEDEEEAGRIAQSRLQRLGQPTSAC